MLFNDTLSSLDDFEIYWHRITSPWLFPSFAFLQHHEIFPALDRPTWHLIHDHKSIKWSLPGLQNFTHRNPLVVIYSRLWRKLCEMWYGRKHHPSGSQASPWEKLRAEKSSLRNKDNWGKEPGYVCLWAGMVEKLQPTSSRSHQKGTSENSFDFKKSFTCAWNAFETWKGFMLMGLRSGGWNSKAKMTTLSFWFEA